MKQGDHQVECLSIADVCKTIQSKLTGESLECFKRRGGENVLHNYQRLISNRKRIDDDDDLDLQSTSQERMAKEVADFIGLETILELKRKVEIDQDPNAMLHLADRHMHVLLPDYELRSSNYACDLYYKAADCGQPEACIAVAILCYTMLLPAEIRDTTSPGGQPLPRSCINLPMYAQMWFYLDKAAEIGYKCPFLLRLAQSTLAQGLPLPEHVAYICDQHKQQIIELQTKCGYNLCTTTTTSTTNNTTPPKLQLCSRCLSIKYCSKECQKAHYSMHKIKCRQVAKVKRLSDMPVKKGEDGDDEVDIDIPMKININKFMINK